MFACEKLTLKEAVGDISPPPPSHFHTPAFHSLRGLPPRPEQWRAPGAQPPHRPRPEEAVGRVLEGTTRHAEIWQRQIRRKQHRKAPLPWANGEICHY